MVSSACIIAVAYLFIHTRINSNPFMYSINKDVLQSSGVDLYKCHMSDCGRLLLHHSKSTYVTLTNQQPAFYGDILHT